MWYILIWGVPAMLATLAGAMLGGMAIGAAIGLVWIIVCVAAGLIIVEQPNFVVVERVGRYHATYFSGWHVLIIIVDRVRNLGTLHADLRAWRMDLYGTAGTQIDFLDGSAPIRAYAWIQVGDPADIRDGAWRSVAEAARRWVYTYADPEKRIVSLIDGKLRPILQDKTIDQASTERADIARAVLDTAMREEFCRLGIYVPSDQDPLLIEDIVLPPEVLRLRLEKLAATKRAQSNQIEAEAIHGPIKQVADALGISIEEAMALWRTNEGNKVLKEVKPDMTIVDKSMRGVLINLDAGRNEGEKK